MRYLQALIALLLAAAASAQDAVLVSPATLTVWNRDIVEFRRAVGWSTPSQRAAAAAARIEALPEASWGVPVTVRAAEGDGIKGVLIAIDGHFLFGLAPEDLDSQAGETLESASAAAAARLHEALAARQEQESPGRLARGIGIALGATLGLVLGLLLLGWLQRRLLARIVPESFRSMPHLFGIDLRPVAAGMLGWCIRLPLVVLMLLAVYLWLTFVCTQFPYSRPWATAMGEFLVGLLHQGVSAVIAALPGLFVVAVILVLARLVNRALGVFFQSVEDGRLELAWMHPETAKASRRIVVVLVWLFAIILSYPYLPGSGSEAFKGVSVFAGLMLTLGSAGMVNQVMSGLVVVYSRTMRSGDIVQVGETVGTVTELGFLSTKVRTPRQEEVTIPNAVLVGTQVTNHSRFDDGMGMVLTTTVTIGYDTPWRQVQALLLLAASRTPGLRPQPEPFVVQRALGDWYVEYELRVRLERPVDRFTVLSRLHAEIQDAFNEHGVQIMSPHFVAQPAQPVIVPKAAWSPTVSLTAPPPS